MCDHSVRALEFLRHTIISGGLRFLQFHYLKEFQNFCGTQSQFLWHVVTKGTAEFLWHVVTTGAAEFLQQPVTNRAAEFLRNAVTNGADIFLQHAVTNRAAESLRHAVTNGAEEFLWHVVTMGAAEFLRHAVTNGAAEFLHHPFMLAVKMHTFYEQTTLFNPNYTNITTFLSDMLHIAEINTHLN